MKCFSGPKSLRDFRETGPSPDFVHEFFLRPGCLPRGVRVGSQVSVSYMNDFFSFLFLIDDQKMEIIDHTETNLIALRRTIYLTIQSRLFSLYFSHPLLFIYLFIHSPTQTFSHFHSFFVILSFPFLHFHSFVFIFSFSFVHFHYFFVSIVILSLF